MKKLLVGACAMFVGVASATTVNLNWTVDNTNYAQTTCETGGDLILPNSAPTKYGYTFRGWTLVDEIITGTVTRNGTPTPSNPIYPTFYENNGMILRAVGDIADTYSTMTGIITRRIGVKVLDGTEGSHFTAGMFVVDCVLPIEKNTNWQTRRLASHGVCDAALSRNNYIEVDGSRVWFGGELVTDMGWSDATEGSQWLADQYANGTPVTVYYPLAEPTQEVWMGQ